MSELFAYVGLGFHHIADPAAWDHLLFLFALAAIYRGGDWRNAVWVVTAFTAGHSATLAVATTGAVVLPTGLIEFLIPLTIVATGIENLRMSDQGGGTIRGRSRPVLAGVFGLVHGAGFANYLRSLFTGSIAVPLLGFNLGIELGQLIVLAGAAGLLAGMDQLVGHRRRVVAVSAVVVLLALPMALSRLPW